MHLSKSVLLHFRSRFLHALEYLIKTETWFLWYLVFEDFTQHNFWCWNPISSLVKVRCLLATGCLKWLNFFSTTIKIPLLAVSVNVQARNIYNVSCHSKGERFIASVL